MKVKAKLKLNDWNIEEGKTYTTRAGHKNSMEIDLLDGKDKLD